MATQLLVWMALGPFFLVATLSAVLLQFSSDHYLVSAMAMSGLFLCWIFKMRGFVIAAIAVGAALAFGSPENLFAQTCLLVPILAALFLTALCMQEVSDSLQKREEHMQNLTKGQASHAKTQSCEKAFSQKLLSENQILKTQLNDNQKWTSQLKNLMSVGQAEVKRTREVRSQLLDQWKGDQKRITALERKLAQAQKQPAPTSSHISSQQLLHSLNDMRVRTYQMELLAKQYRDQLKSMRPKLTELAKLKIDYLQLKHNQKPALAPPSDTDHKLRQLRSQFEEKDHELHLSRKKFYQAQTRALCAERTIKETEHHIPYDAQVLTEHISTLTFEADRLREENKHLTELITLAMRDSVKTTLASKNKC